VLSTLLEDYEATAKSTQFSSNTYPCSICLETLKGAKCIRLSCSHTFCRTCLGDYWQSCIVEGDVERVRCPDPGCMKVKGEANPEDIARVVTEAELQRWRWLREKKDIEKGKFRVDPWHNASNNATPDPSIIHCPMTFCQAPVPRPKDSGGAGWERLRSCSACSLSFCAFCRRTWYGQSFRLCSFFNSRSCRHGPHTPCPIAQSEKLVRDYLALPEGSSERVFMERRFGRENVLRLVMAFEEAQATQEWLKSSTTPCPGCNVPVEKSLGCNHVSRWLCGELVC
jgi:E3 ubiquitin-protein ligase RNF14